MALVDMSNSENKAPPEYEKLIKRRNFLFLSLLLVVIILFILFTLGVSEEVLMVIWLTFIPLFSLGALMVIFGSNCPWCKELFYFVNPLDKGRVVFFYLFNSKCLHCRNPR